MVHVYRFISPRFNEVYNRTRGNAQEGIPSDRTYAWTREINGKKFDFYRIRFRASSIVQVFVTPHNKTNRLHEFTYRNGKLTN